MYRMLSPKERVRKSFHENPLSPPILVTPTAPRQPRFRRHAEHQKRPSTLAVKSMRAALGRALQWNARGADNWYFRKEFEHLGSIFASQSFKLRRHDGGPCAAELEDSSSFNPARDSGKGHGTGARGMSSFTAFPIP